MSSLAAVLYYCLPHLVFALVFVNWDAEKAVHLLFWAKNALLNERQGAMSYWIRYVIVPLVRAVRFLERLPVRIYKHLKSKFQPLPKPQKRNFLGLPDGYRSGLCLPDDTQPLDPRCRLAGGNPVITPMPPGDNQRQLFENPNWEMVFATRRRPGEVPLVQQLAHLHPE
ncbi:hypothetical protein QBC34DRAFT_458655 [Podospora aff. communis PSN243]|uniref:Uncharacterized protein n=1 Tax=Podospora aff. communis PSN243 TaxID=3040156 RepID=A0AAV9GRA1_9PEZI|nr:hypothetical protein QBC34DRAFT_458655 [Podospora aff. communis PSN243]